MEKYIPENLERWKRPECFVAWSEHWAYSGECFVFLGRHRDSDLITETNFEVALLELGGESDTVRVIRENHWAVGWVEWIAIHESDAAALENADGIASALEEYPIIDDEAVSESEIDAASEYWEREPLAGRIQICRDALVSIFAARRDDLEERVFDELVEIVRS